jgi:hypothetical protein
MTLKDLLRRLSYGELSNVFLGASGAGTIPDEKLPIVIQYINEGLLRLYTKYMLSLKSLIIECSEYRTTYILTSEHSWLNASQEDLDNPEFSDKYIRDDPEHPFTDDLIKVLTATLGDGVQTTVNNEANRLGIFTPSFNVIELQHSIVDMPITITYQAKHPELSQDDLDAEIELPYFLYGALCSYVAYLMYSNMNTQEAVQNGTKYLNNYQMILQDLEQNDIMQQTYSDFSAKFHSRGFI